MPKFTFTDDQISDVLREGVTIVDEVFPVSNFDGTEDALRPVAYGKVLEFLFERAREQQFADWAAERRSQV